MESAKNKLEEFFSRGVALNLDPGGVFRKKLEDKVAGEYKKDIIIKFGVDPTRPDIHLGHAVILRKLRTLQDLGCKVVFLVGDVTAHIGDPSGKSKVRPEVESAEIEKNMQTYLEQVKKILTIDERSFSWIRNSDWFYSITDIDPSQDIQASIKIMENGQERIVPLPPKTIAWKAALYEETRMQTKVLKKNTIQNISLQGFLWTLRRITYSRLIERDMFQERIKNGDELYMHEMVYPVLQGIDSHVIANVYGSCDLEIGGTDQTFNMLMGRDVMKINKQEEQAVMTIDLLTGTDGKEKMSKSLDNYIGISEPADQIYGKVMSIPDSSIETYFTLCTYTPAEDIQQLIKGHPRDVKMRLAKEITAIYHGEEGALRGEENFKKAFQKKEIPEEVQEERAKKGASLIDVFAEVGVAESKSELRRLATSGGIKLYKNGEWETVGDILGPVSESGTWKIGKKKFLKIIVEE